MLTISKNNKGLNYEEQINANTLRIKEKYMKVNKLIITSCGLDVINLFVYFISSNLFRNFVNLVSIILNGIFCLFCFFQIKNGFNVVDERLLGKGKGLFYGSIINLSVYVVNMLFLVVFKVFLNIEQFLYIKDNSVVLYAVAVLGIMLYLIFNSLIQVMLLYKFSSCLKLMTKCDNNEKSFMKIGVDGESNGNSNNGDDNTNASEMKENDNKMMPEPSPANLSG